MKDEIEVRGVGLENNIKVYLKESVWKVVYWIDLAEDRDIFRAVVVKVMNVPVPSDPRNF